MLGISGEFFQMNWLFQPSIEDCTKLFFCFIILNCLVFEISVCSWSHWAERKLYKIQSFEKDIILNAWLSCKPHLELSGWFGSNAKVFLNWFRNSALHTHNLNKSEILIFGLISSRWRYKLRWNPTIDSACITLIFPNLCWLLLLLVLNHLQRSQTTEDFWPVL